MVIVMGVVRIGCMMVCMCKMAVVVRMFVGVCSWLFILFVV